VIRKRSRSVRRGAVGKGPKGTSLAAYPTARTVLKTSGRGDSLAEFNRVLRPAVIARKVSQCSKNTPGAQAFAAFKSVVQTMAKQGTASTVEGLYRLFRSTRPHAASP
jgi:hypothetical protein